MNRVIWIVALGAAFELALNWTMVMPVPAMAFGRIPGTEETLATLIGSAEIAGIALYCLLLPRLALRGRRRMAIAAPVPITAGTA